MTLQRIDFELRGDHIALDALLKATGLAPSGGAAKRMVADGLVQVDGRIETRKTCKIRAGQVVALQGARIHVQAAAGIDGLTRATAGAEEHAARGADPRSVDAALSGAQSRR